MICKHVLGVESQEPVLQASCCQHFSHHAHMGDVGQGRLQEHENFLVKQGIAAGPVA